MSDKEHLAEWLRKHDEGAAARIKELEAEMKKLQEAANFLLSEIDSPATLASISMASGQLRHALSETHSKENDDG